MDQYSYSTEKRKARAKARRRLMKALEPQERFCNILKKKVTVLVEYPDYKGRHYKGEPGAIYCENIIDCYQKNIKCKYSGISPLYPDPFGYEDPDVAEAEYKKLVEEAKSSETSGTQSN
ncbi:MAG: hypothetical protein J7M18_07835 [Candidatus Eremiobacteraeota bacterium]|nr:hypothetical protein [Candidatus Eremiobacteraeota bacterium]